MRNTLTISFVAALITFSMGAVFQLGRDIASSAPIMDDVRWAASAVACVMLIGAVLMNSIKKEIDRKQVSVVAVIVLIMGQTFMCYYSYSRTTQMTMYGSPHADLSLMAIISVFIAAISLACVIDALLDRRLLLSA